jgi:hypothetical protein
MVKFLPLGTNKEGVVTYTKDFFLKEKNPPKLPYLQGGEKKKKVEIIIFRLQFLWVSPIYI